MPKKINIPQQLDAQHDPVLSADTAAARAVPLGIDTTHAAVTSALQLRESLEPINVFGIPVVFSNDGPKKSFKEKSGVSEIHINQKRFANEDHARRAGILAATHLSAMRESLASDTQNTLKLLGESKSTNTALLLRGLRSLKDIEPLAAATLNQNNPAPLGLTQQFDYACETYVLTGRMPEGISEEVTDALKKLEARGKNALDVIVQENRTLESSVALYGKYVFEARKLLKKQEGDLKKTEHDEYTPPPFSGEMEPLDPQSVRFKIEPFKGGYCRGQVFRYDPTQGKLVATPCDSIIFQPQDISEDQEDQTPYTFRGSYIPGGDNILPFPENTLPFTHTIVPKTLQLRRNARGTFFIEPKDEKNIAAPIDFSFTFIVAQTDDNRIDDEPTIEDLNMLPGQLSEETETFLEKLRSNTFLSVQDKARAIVSYVKQKLRYPEEEEMSEMNAVYASAGQNIIQAIEQKKVTDCHWSNIYASELGKRLGIPWRMPTGYFVKKMPDIDYAAIGGIGHAWSEVWLESEQIWMRLDATPSKENQEKGEDEELSEDQEVTEDSVLLLTDEEIESLLKEIEQEVPSAEGIADQLFFNRTNVDPAAWKNVKNLIDRVNKTKISSDAQIPETQVAQFRDRITAEPGTLEREWQKLFCLIYKNRRIPVTKFRGPVRQSEGTRIRDVVDTYIDVMANDPDPSGYEMEATKTRNKIDITEFEEDGIIDLTSSMDTTDDAGNIMRIEQKKLILSMMYQIMKLNEKLNDSRIKNDMREPVEIRTELYSIHGGGSMNQGRFAKLKDRTETLTEKALVDFAAIMDKTSPGSGDLVTALKKYREGISEALKAKIKKGKFMKMLTIYSDGNMWCSECGMESCNMAMHQTSVKAAKEEVKMLREMGIIVQGIGFTSNANAIKLIARDPQDPDAAIVISDTAKAVAARQKMLQKHLLKL